LAKRRVLVAQGPTQLIVALTVWEHQANARAEPSEDILLLGDFHADEPGIRQIARVKERAKLECWWIRCVRWAMMRKTWPYSGQCRWSASLPRFPWRIFSRCFPRHHPHGGCCNRRPTYKLEFPTRRLIVTCCRWCEADGATSSRSHR
jgi:hypothetical protein